MRSSGADPVPDLPVRDLLQCNHCSFLTPSTKWLQQHHRSHYTSDVSRPLASTPVQGPASDEPPALTVAAYARRYNNIDVARCLLSGYYTAIFRIIGASFNRVMARALDTLDITHEPIRQIFHSTIAGTPYNRSRLIVAGRTVEPSLEPHAPPSTPTLARSPSAIDPRSPPHGPSARRFPRQSHFKANHRSAATPYQGDSKGDSKENFLGSSSGETSSQGSDNEENEAEEDLPPPIIKLTLCPKHLGLHAYPKETLLVFHLALRAHLDKPGPIARPSREPELLPLRWRNTAAAPRNLYLREGTVLFITEYRKS
ncbi:hypothetical protein ATEIFO6365_0014036000 [Aspergillus terreus]|uniref:Uncharacterized protein n=1 Tax=Aspergillus terreus TaxID=33178 RepID=A0A5M3Z7Y0_ASPTE|nr:hypothetical protein ATETN484_0008060000 [Aspergillus terreus]GFF21428.1 hypothetical protein ATEIFO6365_0014036000 [Aspergillus terreus]